MQYHSIDVLYKTLFLFFVSILLLLLEPRIEGIVFIRKGLNYLLTPAYVTVDWTVKQQNILFQFWGINRDRVKTTSQLKLENLLLKEEIRNLKQFKRENIVLKELLDYSKNNLNDNEIKVSKIIGGKVNSHIKELIFDLGLVDGIKEGMVIISDKGLVGQVIAVGISTGKILAITDPRHSVPVMVQRTKDRFILDGNGDDTTLSAIDLHTYINVREGDILLTSGLGGRFPPGIPVATVANIKEKERVSLRDLEATPLAQPRMVELIVVRNSLPYAELIYE